MLENFSFIRLHFTILALENIILPNYKGSTFRGAFGIALKRVMCSNRKGECETCLLRDTCMYNYIFNTSPGEDAEIMTKYKKVPQPFIMEPPQNYRNLYQGGERIQFSLVLIGKALDYLPYFIYTIKELGEYGLGRGRRKYKLKSVMWENKTGELKEIFNFRKNIINRTFREIVLGDFDHRDLNRDTLSINFETPTRIIYNGDFLKAPEFHGIIRNLLRRIGNLHYFHCGEEKANIKYKELIKKAEAVKLTNDETYWFDWIRFSQRQKAWMRLGGFMGSATYEGDFEDFLPFLWLGQWIHVGKNTTFGLGKYKIST